jgi:hypothetical protein
MPKIDSIPLSPTVSRIFDAFVKKLETDELDEVHVEALPQADHLHRAFNPNL